MIVLYHLLPQLKCYYTKTVFTSQYGISPYLAKANKQTNKKTKSVRLMISG